MSPIRRAKRNATGFLHGAPELARFERIQFQIQRPWVSRKADRSLKRGGYVFDGHKRRRAAEVGKYHPGQFSLPVHSALRSYLPDSDFAAPPRLTLTISAMID